MSLYDECSEISKRSQAQPWTPGINFLESHLRTKKASSTGNKSSKITSTLAPVINLQMRKKSTASTSSKSILKNTMKSSLTAKSTFFLDPEYDWGYENEYDPAHFCNYYKVHDELEVWRVNEERRKTKMIEEDRDNLFKQKRRLSKNFLSNYGYDSDDCGSSDEKELNTSSQRGRGAEFAPPPTSLESTRDQRALNSSVTSTQSGEDVAVKIMAKYGFKAGQGLGKDEQGMSTALQVERIVRNCGRILHEKDLMPPPTQEISTKLSGNQSITPLLKNPSKVILLCNMVGSGEIDSELESEIKDECQTKYGDVVRVLIYERQKVLDEEAVRVFVEFKRSEVAMKAVVDLNGRYFGGRTVRAQFYNFDRYKAYKLDD